MRTFKRRRGASLLIVLALCLMAALAVTGAYLHFQWSQVSTITARQRFLTRLDLASLAAKGRRWLDAGAFEDLRSADERGVLEIYNLSRDISAGSWREDLFPPRAGAFLVRASKGRMTLEVVLLASGDKILDKPLMWREKF